jgi:hypothetical protein
MKFKIFGELTNIETNAIVKSIRILPLFNRKHAKGRWCKKNRTATVKLYDGNVRIAEIHWYEVLGVRKRDLKIKFPFLD